MGILDGIVEWIAEQVMYGLDLMEKMRGHYRGYKEAEKGSSDTNAGLPQTKVIKHLTPTRWCQMRSLTDFKSKKSEKTASVFLPHLLTNLILFGVKNPVGVNYWCQKS